MATHLLLVSKRLRELVEEWRKVLNGKSSENPADIERKVTQRLVMDMEQQQVIKR